MIPLIAFLAAATICKVQDAGYKLRHHPEVSSNFVRIKKNENWPSGLALGVTNSKKQQTTWWLPYEGGTDGLQNLASTDNIKEKAWELPNPENSVRPMGSRQVILFDENYNILPHIPVVGDPAPKHIIVTNAGDSHDTAFPWVDIFDFVDCGQR